jgi:hypothetical protein
VARIRTVKPQFWESESLAELPRDARLMFIGMWNHADDEGRMRGRPALVRSNVFPYEADITIPMVEHWLEGLERVGSIRSYTVHGKPYIDIPEWSKHQVINRPQPSALPSYEERDIPPTQATSTPITEPSVNDHGAFNGGMEEEWEKEKDLKPVPKTGKTAPLAKRLTAILPDGLPDQLQAGQAICINRAWVADEHQLRHSIADVELADNPIAYLISVSKRILRDLDKPKPRTKPQWPKGIPAA